MNEISLFWKIIIGVGGYIGFCFIFAWLFGRFIRWAENRPMPPSEGDEYS